MAIAKPAAGAGYIGVGEMVAGYMAITIQAYNDCIRQAVEAERERCAKLVERCGYGWALANAIRTPDTEEVRAAEIMALESFDRSRAIATGAAHADKALQRGDLATPAPVAGLGLQSPDMACA